MNKVREILRLKETAQMSVRMISRALTISRPVVDAYLKQAHDAGVGWEEACELGDEELLERLSPTGRQRNADEPRYQDLMRRLPAIAGQIGKNHVTRELLWEEYRREYPGGYEYSQFCLHLNIYLADSDIAMHLEHEPGKRLFIDFAGDRPSLIDQVTGSERKAELFVSVFPASGLIYSEATETQGLGDLVLGTRHTFEYAEGAPLIIVPDNLRAAVTKSDRYEPDINRTFEDFGRYYGCVVMPARVRRPRDKALVEAAVHLVYSRVLAPLRHRSFSSIEELNEAMWPLLDELNERVMRKIGLSRRERFEAMEAKVLIPLPVRPYTMRRFIDEVTVQMNYHVYFTVDKHYYSVPYRYRNKKVRIGYTETEVEIYHANIRIASHRRERGANQYTTTPDHMPSRHRIMSEWSPERFLHWAAEYGEATRGLIAAVLESREVPEQAFRSALGILSLGKKYGSVRLEAASRRALRYRITSYKGLGNILKRGLEQDEQQEALLSPIPAHPNIRGGEYYSRLRGGA
jgi:transposase